MTESNKKHGFWRLEKELPWLTSKSIEFIDKNMKLSHKVLEFGSGASTIFFARRSKKVISFESGGYSTRKGNLERSLEWYKNLTNKLKFNDIKIKGWWLHDN